MLAKFKNSINKFKKQTTLIALGNNAMGGRERERKQSLRPAGSEFSLLSNYQCFSLLLKRRDARTLSPLPEITRPTHPIWMSAGVNPSGVQWRGLALEARP